MFDGEGNAIPFIQYLPKEAFDHFMEVCNNPPAPTQVLIDLLKGYKKRQPLSDQEELQKFLDSIRDQNAKNIELKNGPT
jgi:hypothetical protein